MKKRTALALGAAAVAAAMLLRRGALREDVDWEDVEKPGVIADIDGYGVHYVESGAGPAMLLIHGFGGSANQFRKIMPIFARDHRVIAVDLKGFGYSQRDRSKGLSHTDQVAMLEKLLARLGVERAVVLGHSMGGAVAQRFAATRPDAVEALVLVASVSGDDRRVRRLPVPSLFLRPWLPLLGRFAADRLLAASFYDRAQLTDEVRDHYLRPARIRGSMDGLMKMIEDASSDAPVATERLTMPVLILNGAQDPVVPLERAQRIRERIPHARLVVIDRAAHLLLEERPDECARAIGDFLREARAGAAAAASG